MNFQPPPFRTRIFISFSVILMAGLLSGGFFVQYLRSVESQAAARALSHTQYILGAERIRGAADRASAEARAYLLTGQKTYLAEAHRQWTLLDLLASTLHENASDPEQRRRLQSLIEANGLYQNRISAFLSSFRFERIPGGMKLDLRYSHDILPLRQRLIESIDAVINLEQKRSAEQWQLTSDARWKRERLSVALTLALLIGVSVLLYTMVGRLSRLYEAAETATRDKSELLAAVSHDLRNPICAALLCTERIISTSSADAGDARILKLAQAVRGALVDSTQLISGLLEHGRIEDGKYPMNSHEASIDALVEESVAILRPIAHAKHLEISVDVPSGVQIPCDRDRIKQVIGNIVGNAIKFSPDGGKVELTATVEEQHVVFTVEDQGPGIPEDQRSRIFEKYWQAGGARKKGSGLGLSIARSFVEAHGGRIWIEGPADRGTRFRFSLPRTAAPAQGRGKARRLALYKRAPQYLQNSASTS